MAEHGYELLPASDRPRPLLGASDDDRVLVSANTDFGDQ